MRFMVINCVTAIHCSKIATTIRHEPVLCAHCMTIIEKSFVRDLETRLVYCTIWCYDTNIFESQKYIEDHARRVT